MKGKMYFIRLIVIAIFTISIMFTSLPVGQALPTVTVYVDTGDVIDYNPLETGFQISSTHWRDFRNDAEFRQLATDGGFRMERFFDRIVNPCTYWNENTQTGTWSWSTTDDLVRKIFETGAEPVISLSQWRDSNDPNGWNSVIPRGMAVNPSTLLPYPSSYANFVAEWVRHYQNIGLPVRYYEIFNEIQTYVGWDPPGNTGRINNFIDLFEAAYNKMHQVNPNVMVSTDSTLEKHIFDNFYAQNVDIDFFDFHKYEAWKYPQYDDDTIFEKSEEEYFETDWSAYSITEARQKWFNRFGKWIPVICSESNMNAAFSDGSDPRIQQMSGTVRTALVLRQGMLNDLNNYMYFDYASSYYFESSYPSGGAGFGMINLDDNDPWYPYYLMKMVGTNLSPNDPIYRTTVSDNNNFRAIAWDHNGKTNVLVICLDKGDYTVVMNGLSGTPSYEKLDENISWFYPQVQTGTGSYIDVNGYAVMLVQSDSGSPPPPPPPPPGDLTIDDTEASYVGTWDVSTTTAGYYGSGYRYHTAGSGSNRATFSFSIAEAAEYEVFARWTSASNRATDAPYTVNHADGSTTVDKNQEVNNGQWVSLGSYDYDVGVYSVVLSDNANGVVIADAVMLEKGDTPPPPPPPPPGDIIVDDTEASYVGTWDVSTTTAGYYGSGYRYHTAGSGTNRATWSFIINEAASYEVFARWTSASNRATDAPYTVNHADGSTTVDKNQEVNNGQWISLGEYDFDIGAYSVRLSDSANGVVIADAVMLVKGDTPPPPPPPPGDIIVDDTEASYVGTWQLSTTTDGYYGSGYRYRWAGSGANRATFSFSIAEAAEYEVFARWTSQSNRATDAPYTVNHADGSTTVDKNQEVNNGRYTPTTTSR